MTTLKTLPLELTSLNCWTTWHYEYKERREKPVKRPDVPANWYDKPMKSFNQVVEEHAKDPNKGIGIAFTRTNGIVGIDIDNVPDKEIPPAILAILKFGKTGGYVERSVSRTGFHIIGECTFKPLLLKMFQNYNHGTGAKSSDKHLEMYAADHFFTVSGFTIICDWKNIDNAIIAAWEYITGTNFLSSVAACYGEPQRSGIPTNTQAKEPAKSVATLPQPPQEPWPADAYTDEDIMKLPKHNIKRTIELMYRKKPILRRILEIDGHAATEDYYTVYPPKNKTKDTSASGFDEEIAGTLCFWLYRYGPDEIIRILETSKLNREDKGEDYWTATVEKAYNAAFLFFPATPTLDAEKAKRVEAWKNHKQKLAMLMGLKG